ncbi:MAG: mycofactocin biosynthesis chaperone MftB, partial [Thermodesulfobacteriota bacterium]|nr:mycofactocin biosynthesis chaperone MftB [Thermodesulfobacteriota bacterium]
MFLILKLAGSPGNRFVGFLVHIGSGFQREHQDGKFNEEMKEPKYILAPGTQVREEDFGLLFYTMTGPRLYFLSSGTLLADSFFQGK